MSTVRRAPWVVTCLLLSVLLTGCTGNGGPAHDPLVNEDGRPLSDAVRLLRVGAHLESPVGVAALPEDSGRLLVIEQAGTLAVLDGRTIEDVDKHEASRIGDLTDRIGAGGERGLLGIAPHPDWPDDPRLFLHYTDTDGDTVLSAFELTDDPLRLHKDTEQVLLQQEQPYSNHNGGQLQFGPDGYLHLALGDGGAGGDPHGNGQDPHTLLGAILRIDIDADGDAPYGIPSDNPFADGQEGAPEVFVYGLRNPWRFSYDKATGDMWIGDVGQEELEEVTRLPSGAVAGANLGWNVFEGSRVFAGGDAPDAVDPTIDYEHAGRHCSVVGGHVYHGQDVPSWEGMYVFGDFCSGWIWGLRAERSASAAEAEAPTYTMGRLFEAPMKITAFGEDGNGELYVVDHIGAVWRFAAR